MMTLLAVRIAAVICMMLLGTAVLWWAVFLRGGDAPLMTVDAGGWSIIAPPIGREGGFSFTSDFHGMAADDVRTHKAGEFEASRWGDKATGVAAGWRVRGPGWAAVVLGVALVVTGGWLGWGLVKRIWRWRRAGAVAIAGEERRVQRRLVWAAVIGIAGVCWVVVLGAVAAWLFFGAPSAPTAMGVGSAMTSLPQLEVVEEHAAIFRHGLYLRFDSATVGLGFDLSLLRTGWSSERYEDYQQTEITVGWVAMAWPGVVLVAIGAVELAAMLWPSRVEAMRCPTCGYDVRASPERCPECGTLIAVV